MSGMMSIDMVHQLHHHDWANNTLKTSNRTCNDLTSCLYLPCFSVANMLTLQTYFSTSLRMLCSVIQSLRFLWLLCGNIKSEKICPGNQPHFVPWNLHCHECVFVATLQRKCHRIGESKSIYLKTSQDLSSCHMNGFQGTKMSANLVKHRENWRHAVEHLRNKFLPLEKWEILRNPCIHMISTLDMRKLVVAI